MREIEFRAWLKKEKKMVDVREINFASEQISFEIKDDILFALFDEIKLMQSTKINDIKIFEDDIVEFTTGTYTSIGIVKFYDGMFVVEDIEDRDCTEILSYCDELKVLGNIWENSELLAVE